MLKVLTSTDKGTPTGRASHVAGSSHISMVAVDLLVSTIHSTPGKKSFSINTCEKHSSNKLYINITTLQDLWFTSNPINRITIYMVCQ